MANGRILSLDIELLMGANGKWHKGMSTILHYNNCTVSTFTIDDD